MENGKLRMENERTLFQPFISYAKVFPALWWAV